MSIEENKSFNEMYAKVEEAKSFEEEVFIQAQWWLGGGFDINNFSMIELAHLKRIVKKVIADEAEIEKQNLNIQTEYRFGSYYAEAGKRWLWELYGVNYREEKNNNELISRIKFLREQAHNPSLE